MTDSEILALSFTLPGPHVPAARTFTPGQRMKTAGGDWVDLPPSPHAARHRKGGDDPLALGDLVQGTGEAFGAGALSARDGWAMGANAKALAEESLALGRSAETRTGSAPVALGHESFADGSGATALGRRTKATAQGTVAIGQSAEATASLGVAIGYLAAASNVSATAVGRSSISSGDSSVALGRAAEATATSAVASGYGAKATANYASAYGPGTQALGAGAIAVGRDTIANNQFGIAIGHETTVSSNDGIAIGRNAQVPTSLSGGSVAIGNGSVASASAQIHMGARHVELKNVTTLANPSAGAGRFGFMDNGSGKMQFVARFPSGAIHVLATEA